MNYLSCWMAEPARLSLNVRLHVTHARRCVVSLQQQTVTVHTCLIIIFKWLKLVAVWQKTNTNYRKVSLMFRSVKGSGWTWRWPFFHCFLCRLPSRDHDVSSSPPADDINICDFSPFMLLAYLLCTTSRFWQRVLNPALLLLLLVGCGAAAVVTCVIDSPRH